MRLRPLVLVAVIGLMAPPVAAQTDDESGAGAPVADGDEASPNAKTRPGDGDDGDEAGAPTAPADEPAGEPTDAPGEQGGDDGAPPATPPPAPSAPPPSPDPAPSRSPIKKLAGALVVARTPMARAAARALARDVYRDARLRPAMQERTAQILVGGEPAKGNAEQAQIASVVKALDTVDDEEVRRRLLTSLADDLSAQLVVEVALDDDGQARARVLRLPDERFLGVTLTARRGGEPAAWRWDDAVGILRGLLVGPPPGPRTAPAAAPVPKPADTSDDGESDWDLLKSPWFWGGLGVVVTVGVTVLILSQTALNEPDVVMLEGRVGP